MIAGFNAGNALTLALNELFFHITDRLNAAARSFGRTADENWDSRLALPASFGQPVNTDDLYRRASQKLNEGFFVNVEVD